MVKMLAKPHRAVLVSPYLLKPRPELDTTRHWPRAAAVIITSASNQSAQGVHCEGVPDDDIHHLRQAR